MPLWAQVLEDMRRRLASGEFTIGFPPERELVEQYDVSRHTMREAMRRLHNEGLIDRERGRGTFVREQPIEQRTGALYSLFRSIEDQGFEQRSVVLALERCRDPEIASQLELPANTWFVYLHRVRKAAEIPIAIDELWLPASVAQPLLDADFEHTSVYKELDERCGVRPGAGWERLHPVLPTKDERTLLDVKSKEPAFLIERFTSFDGRPLEWRRSIIRGDRYTFVTNWTDSGTATDPPSFAPTSEAV
jgi:GntR family transcriptional regulator